MRRVLVIANETVTGSALTEALRRRATEGELQVTVVCPVSRPREGYVVYEDTRRASARRRLDRTIERLRAAGIPADGLVVDADPVSAAKDALAQLEPDEVIVSTHPSAKSGWLRRNVVEQVRKAAGAVPVEHVVVDLGREEGERNVLVIANETVVGRQLLERIRERAAASPSSFLIICPQSDLSMNVPPEAERRLRRALADLRSHGVDAHGQIAHPDPYTAAMHMIRDERVDELIVSTFPGELTSSWLRGNLVERLRKDAGLPVEHVEVEPEGAKVPA